MSDASGTTSYSYDNANRTTAIAQPNGTVDFSYDNADRLSVRTLAGVGTSTFTYDNAGRVTNVAVPGATGSETTSYTYDSANRKLTTTFADGSVETDSYDTGTADETSVVHETSASVVIASYAYTYNSDARKTQATLADGSYYSYGYDSAGQLTSESLNSGGTGTVGALHGYSYSYAYDSAGNRTSKTVGGTATSYTYDSANKLTAAGTKSYSYDNAGSVTSVYNSSTGITTTLGYDGESRMTSAGNSLTGAGAFSDTFSYNAIDQRYAKSDTTGSFGYTRQDDAIDSPVLSDGAAVYNHGADGGLVSEVRGSASKFYHSDALGSTGALTNGSGSTTDTLITDAYGMTVAGSGSTPSPFGFVGQGGYQGDSDTGLMLLGHRYYDSSVGRFLSRDPIQDGYNWYAYCGNDPINAVDSSGLTILLGGPNDKSVTKEQAEAYLEAIDYLQQSQVGSDEIANLQKSQQVYYVVIVDNGDDGFVHKPSGNNIVTWDPGSANGVGPASNGEYQSPALGLAHEFGHARDYDTDPVKYNSDGNTTDPNYDDKEERNATEGYETPIARQLKEPTRHNHIVKPKRVGNPTSHHRDY